MKRVAIANMSITCCRTDDLKLTEVKISAPFGDAVRFLANCSATQTVTTITTSPLALMQPQLELKSRNWANAALLFLYGSAKSAKWLD